MTPSFKPIIINIEKAILDAKFVTDNFKSSRRFQKPEISFVYMFFL
jgi:hypothetical protein